MDLSSEPEMRSHLRNWENLPPFHPVALQLMRAASSDDVPLSEVAAIIRCDPVFAAEILRLANSLLFGFKREISSILHAVGLLGLERVRGLALTVALRRFLGGIPAAAAARVCWRHNLACAMIAQDFAVAALIPSDSVYTAGLVHDLGRIALLASDPGRYTALLELAEKEPSRTRELERETFGVDHCEAGATLMERWRFPSVLCQIAAAHHAPLNGGGFGLRETIHLACRTADCLGFQVAGPAPPFDTGDVLQPLPAAARSRFNADPDQMATRVAVRINSFEVYG